MLNFVPELSPQATPPISREQLGIAAEATVAAAMGRFIAKKGFQDLIPAFAALGPRLRGRSLQLLLMGDGRGRTARSSKPSQGPLRGACTSPAGWTDR